MHDVCQLLVEEYDLFIHGLAEPRCTEVQQAGAAIDLVHTQQRHTRSLHPSPPSPSPPPPPAPQVFDTTRAFLVSTAKLVDPITKSLAKHRGDWIERAAHLPHLEGFGHATTATVTNDEDLQRFRRYIFDEVLGWIKHQLNSMILKHWYEQVMKNIEMQAADKIRDVLARSDSPDMATSLVAGDILRKGIEHVTASTFLRRPNAASWLDSVFKWFRNLFKPHHKVTVVDADWKRETARFVVDSFQEKVAGTARLGVCLRHLAGCSPTPTPSSSSSSSRCGGAADECLAGRL